VHALLELKKSSWAKNAHEVNKIATSAKKAQVHTWSSCCKNATTHIETLLKKKAK